MEKITDEQHWQAIQAQVRSRMTAPAFETWIKPLKLVGFEGNILKLETHSEFNRDWVLKKYGRILKSAVSEVLNADGRLMLAVCEAYYNNYNLNKPGYNNQDPGIPGDLPVQKHENYKNYKGLYQQIHSDPLFKLAMSWGVEGKMLYACVREYGEYLVKQKIHKVSPVVLSDSYFQRKDRPIPEQRGRLFSHEMRQLRQQRQAS